MTKNTRNLAPLWGERWARLTRPGWARTAHVRRALAALLILLAAVLALRDRPAGAGSSVVVATRDLAPGHVLVDDDLRTVQRDFLPSGAVTGRGDAVGRTLAGAVRTGESLTDVRVVGPALAAVATGASGAISVPVRLADADVAELLHAGDSVDVVAVGEKHGTASVIARGAMVLAVPPGDPKRRSEGRLVVVALPAEEASVVAAASLSQSVTVTFH